MIEFFPEIDYFTFDEHIFEFDSVGRFWFNRDDLLFSDNVVNLVLTFLDIVLDADLNFR